MERKNSIKRSRWYLAGIVPGACALAATLIAASALLSGGALPAEAMEPLIYGSEFLAAAAAGAVSAKARGKGALTAGAASGGVCLLILVICVILSEKGQLLSAMFIRSAICFLAGGLFGGALCLGRGNRLRRSAKKHRR